MSNAILTSWLNLSIAISRLPANEQPQQPKQLKQQFECLLDWYRQFTDIPEAQLTDIPKQFDEMLKRKAKPAKHPLRGAVYSAIEFLRTYLEAPEMVNMSQFGADAKHANALTKMGKKLNAFHSKKLNGFGWLIDWLEQVDPLFPGNNFRNKLACCFADVKQKQCFSAYKQCVFESALSWIRVPQANLSGMAKDDDCCLGSTLSSCSGGTLSCDCVSGNTGCDCKAPNRLCPKNEKSVSISMAGFGRIDCLRLETAGGVSGAGPIKPVCLALDPMPEGGCVLDRQGGTIPGPVCQLLDPIAGRFTSAPGGKFNLGRLQMVAKDCVQTGFCPPKSGGCGGLC